MQSESKIISADNIVNTNQVSQTDIVPVNVCKEIKIKLIPCKNGVSCKFNKYGTCKFGH